MTDTQRVFDLLVKVTDCCDEIEIPYFLGFYPLRLALTQNVLPAGIHTTEIFVFEENIRALCDRLKHEESLEIESLENNPDFDDACIKVVDRGAVFFDLFNPKSKTPSYTLIITPITNAPIKGKEKAFLKAYYGAVRINRYAKKPFGGWLKIFRSSKRISIVERKEGQVSLLRYKYRNRRIPKEYFSGNCKITLNEHRFSCVKYVDAFLSLYYHKNLEHYPLSSKIDINRYVLHPEVPYVNLDFRHPICIRIMGLMIRVLTRLVKKDFSTLQREKKYFFRTSDRFAMIDHYTPLMKDCDIARSEENWMKLGELLNEYIVMAKKYKKKRMPFAFDYKMYDYLIDYLNNAGKEKELLKWLISQKASAFNYLAYVTSYSNK